MSFLIETNNILESHPIIDVPVRRIISPKIRKVLKSNQNNDPAIAIRQMAKEERMLQNLCQKLTDRQFQQLHKKNIVQMQREFTKLKQNLKSTFKAQSIDKIMGDKPKTIGRLNIGKINKISSGQLDMNKKYHDVFSYKIHCLREATRIDKQKQSYRQWMNSQRNNYLTSPIFQRMTFMIEKVRKSDENNEQICYAKRVLFRDRQNHKSTHKMNTESHDKKLNLSSSFSFQSNCVDKENQLPESIIKKGQIKSGYCIRKHIKANKQIGSQRKRQMLLQISAR